MLMPMSWLKPAFAVQRSTLPPRITLQSLTGVKLKVNLNESMVCQVVPLLPLSVYWDVLTLSTGALPVGRKRTLRLVGENLPPIGPAPAKIVPGSRWFAFHCNLAVWVTPERTAVTACTLAAFGEKVPPKPPLSFHAAGRPTTL